MVALRQCPLCETGVCRWDRYCCSECSGENARRSYKERSANLAACLRDAATEEMRVRAAVERVRDTWSLA